MVTVGNINNNLKLKKSDSKFEYFKSQIMKILEEQEKVEKKDIKKSLYEAELLNKSTLPIGYVSTYKDGSKWRKVDKNKWKCVRQAKTYSTESKEAKDSINRLIKKVENATTTDELLDIVMFNINRFEDKNGKILPIVEELKNAVDIKKVTMSPEKKAAFNNLISIVNQENFNKVNGKTREEIFEEYDNTPKAIAIIPKKYLDYFGIKNNKLLCGEAYMLDHMVNHHPATPLELYKRIQYILEQASDFYVDEKLGSFILIEEYGEKKEKKVRNILIFSKDENDNIILHKTFYNSHKNLPTKYKKINLAVKQQGFVSGVDSLTTISQSEKDSNSAFGLNIQGRPNNQSISQNTDLSNSLNPKIDKEYFDAIKNGDMDKVRQMVADKAKENGFENAIPEQADGYSLRLGKAPTKTKTVYKTFYVDTKGKPSTLFIGNNENIPMNVWVDAKDSFHFQDPTNGRFYVPTLVNPNNKKAGKTGDSRKFDAETKKELVARGFITEKANSVTAVAYRPGWHAGDLPFFPQGGTKLKQKTNYDNVHHWNQVVFEIEVDADKDYTQEAQEELLKKKAQGDRSAKADLQYMPEHGFYQFTTNPTVKKQTGGKGDWFISHSMKIKRALSEEDCNKILAENGMKPQEWADEKGNQIEKMDLSKLGYTGEDYDAARKTLAPITYDDNGEIIPLSQRFNRDIDDVRKSFGAKNMTDEKLEYFKNKVLEHLDSLEAEEETDKTELRKSLAVMEKAGFPVGTVRTWKGKEYIKVAPNKWRPKYSDHSRGAKMAIAALKKKAAQCNSSEDLLQLILENKMRFSDDQGRPLDFVKELSDYVSNKNDEIESSKTVKPIQSDSTKTDTKDLETKTEIEAEEKIEEPTSIEEEKPKKENQSLDKFEKIFNEKNKDSENAELFKDVVRVARDLDITISYKAIGERTNGFYNIETNDIKISSKYKNMEGERESQTILHELIHGVTSRVLALDDSDLNESQREGKKEILEVYNAIKTMKKDNNFYGLSSPDEMVAELANPKFKDFLKKQSLFSKIINGIVKLFRKESKGSENIGNAYDKIHNAIYKIIDNYEDGFTEKFNESEKGADELLSLSKELQNYSSITDDNYKEYNDKLERVKMLYEKHGSRYSKRSQQIFKNVINIYSNKVTKYEQENDVKVKESDVPQTDIKSIRKNYESSKSVTGNKKTITLPNGEKMKCHYKLVEAEAPTASHDENTFSTSKGFPTNKDGKNINDRDYKNDKDAQESVRKIANNFNSLALDSPPIVTKDGIVISGNNRTMSSKLAAKNGTDKAYLASLKDTIDEFGIDEEELDGFKNPRIILEVDAEHEGDYTTNEFAQFNQDTKKTMNNVEKAVKLTKTLDSHKIQSIAETLTNYETMGELYADKNGSQLFVQKLVESGIIGDNEKAQYTTSDGMLNDTGKDFAETVLVGSVLNENNIRKLDSAGGKRIRQKLVRAILPLIENKGTGKEYSFNNELNQAVDIAVNVMKDHEKFPTVKDYVSQLTLFDDEKIDDVTARLAEIIHDDGEKSFAQRMKNLGAGLRESASGQQDIFLQEVETKDSLMKRFLDVKKAVAEVLDSVFRFDKPKDRIEKSVFEILSSIA